MVVLENPLPVVNRNSAPCPIVKSSLLVPFINSFGVEIFTLLLGIILTKDGITSLKKNIVLVVEVFDIVVFPSIRILLELQALWAGTLLTSFISIIESTILVVP